MEKKDQKLLNGILTRDYVSIRNLLHSGCIDVSTVILSGGLTPLHACLWRIRYYPVERTLDMAGLLIFYGARLDQRCPDKSEAWELDGNWIVLRRTDLKQAVDLCFNATKNDIYQQFWKHVHSIKNPNQVAVIQEEEKKIEKFNYPFENWNSQRTQILKIKNPILDLQEQVTQRQVILRQLDQVLEGLNVFSEATGDIRKNPKRVLILNEKCILSLKMFRITTNMLRSDKDDLTLELIEQKLVKFYENKILKLKSKEEEKTLIPYVSYLMALVHSPNIMRIETLQSVNLLQLPKWDENVVAEGSASVFAANHQFEKATEDIRVDWKRLQKIHEESHDQFLHVKNNCRQQYGPLYQDPKSFHLEMFYMAAKEAYNLLQNDDDNDIPMH